MSEEKFIYYMNAIIDGIIILMGCYTIYVVGYLAGARDIKEYIIRNPASIEELKNLIEK